MQRIIPLLITLLFLAGTVHSQVMLFRNISWDGRHASSTVRAIYRSDSGFCWLGADRRLLRFDGSHLVDFPLPSEFEGSFYITAIGEIAGQFMTVGTTEGLWRIPDKEGRFAYEQIFSKEIGDVNCIHVNDSTAMTIGTSGGLHIYHYPSEKLKSIYFDRQRHSAPNNVRAIARDKRLLYAATGAGIYVVDLRTLKFKKLVHDLSMADATSIACCNGRLFVGSLTSGLRVYNAVDGRFLGAIDVGCNVVTSLSLNEEGIIYVGTDGNGVFIIDGSDLSIKGHLVKKTPAGGILTSNQVYSVLACAHDDFWVGYYQGAADYSLHLNDNFRICRIPGVFDTHGMTIRTISLSDKGLMLGTRKGLYYLFPDRKTFRHVELPPQRSNMILDILQDGNLYFIGTYGGGCMVYDFNTGTVRDLPVQSEDVFRKGHIFAIARDKNGTIWFGTSEGLIAYKDGRIKHHYTESDSRLPDDNVFEIFFDSTGRGFVGTGKGMAMIDPQTGNLRTDLFPEGFIDSRSIRHIYEDSDHKLYFVPEKGPLTVSNLDMTDFHDVDPELFNNAKIRSVIEDNENQMWITTDNGIFRWDKDQISKRFGFADGVLNPAFINGNAVKTDEGRILTGNPDGLLVFDPKNIEEPADNTPIVITGITCDDRFIGRMYFSPEEDGHYEIDLDSKPHILQVDFSDFLYSKSETTNYEYSLDGANWKKTTSEMSFILYDFHRGHNIVMIRNVQNKGNRIVLDINIPYPWWYWVLPLVALLSLILISVFIHAHRNKRNAASAQTKEMTENQLGRDQMDTVNDLAADSEAIRDNAANRKYNSRRLEETECLNIRQSLEKIMSEHKPFLNQNMTIGDLSELTGVPSHRLSQYFSQSLNQNFYDFINSYRVDEFKRLVRNINTRNLTLSALSEKAGFSSRSTFFRYFKKFEGVTPAEYIQRLD